MGTDFHPLGEWIHGNEEVISFHLCLMEMVLPVLMLQPTNGAPPLSIQHSSSLGGMGGLSRWQTEQCQMQSAMSMHTWPPIGTMEGAKQLVPPAMPKGIMVSASS